jgi:acyl-CoA reductase-like NAD-dependent aldehyde dehydrogenase
MLAWKVAPALACGNTVVLKPAETTPLTALLFAEVCQQADLPPGVVNIITGAGPTGQAIVDHPGIDKIAFTGSTAVGKMIARSIAGTRKKATLELGGKAANIIFDDAPIDQAVEGIVNGIFFNQGHVCCAGSRILVQENIADEVDRRLKRRLATLRVGDPLDKNTDVGAINSRKQLDRIEEMVAVGEAEGAQRWDSGCELPTNGFWFRPTVFSGVSQTHRIAQEEIFGPVVSVLTFRTPAEAVAKANNTPYGLSAGVWTEKGSRILWMADQLRAGVVWANTFNKFDPTSPFGGYKESGYGREGGRGHGRLEAHSNGPASGIEGSEHERAGGCSQDLQALHRREVPPQRESGVPTRCSPRHPAPVAGQGARTEVPRQRRHGLAQGRPGCRRRGSQGAAGWAGATAYNRGQVLYRVAEVMESRRAQFVEEVRASEGLSPAAPRRPSARPSTAGSGTPGGPTSSPRCSAGSTRWPGRTSTSRPPRRPVSWLCWPRSARACSAWSVVVAPVIVSGNSAVVLTSEDRPLPAITLAECLATSDVPGGVVNLVTGDTGEMAPVAGLAPRCQRHRPHRCRRRRGRRAGVRRGCGRREPQARLRPGGAGAEARSSPTGTSTPDLQRLSTFLETKTVWHPKGR